MSDKQMQEPETRNQKRGCRLRRLVVLRSSLAVATLTCVICAICGSLFAQGTSCSGTTTQCKGETSLACAGFVPVPCARTDRIVNSTLGATYATNVDGTWTDNGPQVNVPFINDFGEREVRATDGMIPGGKPIGGASKGPSTWWTNYWSVYDASIGGYYFYTPVAETGEADGGFNQLYVLNPQTMTVSSVCLSGWTYCAMPYVGSWSSKTPGLMYYSTGEDLCSWNYGTESGSGSCSDGAGTLVFNFSTCPDYGTYYSGSVFLDGVSFGDQWLEASFGSTALAAYNTQSGNCSWYSTQYGLVGGTGMSAQGASIPAAAPPTLPSDSLTATTGTGSMPAEPEYYIELTRVSEVGFESTPSAEQSIPLSATGEITISGQSIGGTASSFYTNNWTNTCNIYAGTASGAETLQMSDQSCSDAITLASYSTTGAAPPTLNGAGYNLHGTDAGSGAWMNAEPNISVSNGKGGGSYVLWEPGTANTIPCVTASSDYCEGHESVGQTHIFYNIQAPPSGGVASPYDVGISPNADSSSSNYTHLIPKGPPYYNPYAAIPSAGCNVSDYHSNWTYDNPSDAMPVLWSSFVEPFVGMVEQNGTVSTTAGSTTVTGSGTSFSSSWVGDYIWIGTSGEQGTGLGVGEWAQIASVQSSTELTLSGGAPLTVSGYDMWTYYYPLMGMHCAWDHEIDMVSSSGNDTVWRFAHNRASGVQNQMSNADSSYQSLSMPVCSPDGKYCMFASDWANVNGQGQLGTQTGMWHGSSGNPSGGCYTSCSWKAATAYVADQEIIDSNGNEEMATAGGTSGSTEPAWPTTTDHTVTDGGVTWEMSPGCNTPQSASVAAGGPDDGDGMCRTDVFIVEMK
jgi:hypothetical protein